MRWIVGSSLRFRLLIIPVALTMMVVGFAEIRTMPVDVLPEYAPISVEVQTEALGLSPTEVEQLVTVPMEQDLLNGVPWLAQIRSESVSGMSSIEMIFQSGTNILRARQMVQERLAQAVALPHVSKPPTMLQPVSSSGRLMMIGLTAKDLTPIEMSVLARWRIRPRLMGIPGVANVAIWGQRDRQLQVQVDPERLASHGVTLDQILTTTSNALVVSPLTFVEASTPGTAGFIDTPNQRLSIRHILPITTPPDLAKVTIDGARPTPLTLGDVADVAEDHQPLIGDAVVNGGPGLLLVVEKAPGANTLEVTRQVEQALTALQPGLTGIEINTRVFRPATFITAAVGNLTTMLVLGLVLMIVLVGAFFLEWRAGLISLVTIPLALVAAALVLKLRGETLNAMILVGLLLALGVIVDDAVVDLDNIRQRLRHRRSPDDDRSPANIVLGACLEMRGPLLYATLIVLAAAVPLFFLDGLTGAFARPIALSYALAVLASLLVALTVTPALAVLLLTTAPPRRTGSGFTGWLRRRYAALIARVIGRSRQTLLACGAVLVTGLAVVAGLAVAPRPAGQSALPTFADRNLLIHWEGTPGTARSEMVRIMNLASTELMAVPGIDGVGAHLGRAVTSDQIVGINSGELWVTIAARADYRRTMAAIQKVIDGYPGFQRDLRTYPEQRAREISTGSADPIVVRVSGQDLDILQGKAEEIRQKMAKIHGVVEPRIAVQSEEPSVEIEVNLDAAQEYGLKPGDVRRVTATLLNGLEVGSVFEEQKVFEVIVKGTPATQNSVTSIRSLLLDTPSGGHVRLADVADVRLASTPDVIRHDGVSRGIDITAQVHGRAAGSVAHDIGKQLKTVTFPLEYHAEVVGANLTRASSWHRPAAYSIAAAILVFLLLQTAFGSWRLATLLFAILPLALVGGLLAIAVTGIGVSLASLIGLLAVWAIAARNGVLLVKHYQRIGGEAAGTAGEELVLRGSAERAVPVLMTAITLAVALAPVLLRGGVPGGEVLYPVAVVILGGLTTSTLLTLFVVPTLYLRFGPHRQPTS